MINADYSILQTTDNFIEVVMFGEKHHIDKGYLRWSLQQVDGWQRNFNNFTACLMGLIDKADNNKKKRIAKGFPAEVFAYLLWYYGQDLVSCDREKYLDTLITALNKGEI